MFHDKTQFTKSRGKRVSAGVIAGTKFLWLEWTCYTEGNLLRILGHKLAKRVCICLILPFFFFFPFRQHLAVHGSSQARCQIGAAAASHSHAGSEPCLQPMQQLEAKPDPLPNQRGQG